MKDKIFSALKTTFAKLGLSDEILSQHATMLANMGVVNDDNLDAIIKAQGDYLSNLQKSNDKRVTDALATAKSKAGEELTKKVEEMTKAHEAEVEKLKAELAKLAPKPQPTPTPKEDPMADLMKQYEQKFAESATATAALQKQLEELINSNKTQTEKLASIEKENAVMKAEKARVEREAFIANTAKELGIPEWRMNEGFAIKESDDNDAIKNYLTGVATNIKALGVPSAGGRVVPFGDKTATKDEIDSLVKSIMK